MDAEAGGLVAGFGISVQNGRVALLHSDDIPGHWSAGVLSRRCFWQVASGSTLGTLVGLKPVLLLSPKEPSHRLPIPKLNPKPLNPNP